MHRRVWLWELVVAVGSGVIVELKDSSVQAHQLFEILMREHAPMLTAFIRTTVRDAALADDIWQETMLVAWRRIDEFDRTRPFGPWLRGIAARTILAKRRVQSQLVLVEDPAELDYISDRFEQFNQLTGDTLDDKLEALRDCIGRLSPQERECVEGRYMQGYMPSELSQRLSIELDALKKRLQRAKQHLLHCIERKMKMSVSTEAGS